MQANVSHRPSWDIFQGSTIPSLFLICKIKLLLDHNIALLCYHLPLDAHQEIGNNWKAARGFRIEEI